METNVLIRVRSQDVSLVTGLLDRVKEQYKAQMHRDVNITIDPEENLPPDSCGGVELLAGRRRIKVTFHSDVLHILLCSFY